MNRPYPSAYKSATGETYHVTNGVLLLRGDLVSTSPAEFAVSNNLEPYYRQDWLADEVDYIMEHSETVDADLAHVCLAYQISHEYLSLLIAEIKELRAAGAYG